MANYKKLMTNYCLVLVRSCVYPNERQIQDRGTEVDKQLGTLRGLQFWTFATNGVAAPFLPLYFDNQGYTSAQIGVLMMIGSLLAIFFQPLWGYMSDRMQTVKKVVFLLWSIALLCSIGLFLSESYAYTFWFVLLMYFFLQPSYPLLDSVSIQSAMRRGATYGSIRMFGSIGFASMALIGGYVLQLLGGISNLGFFLISVSFIPLILMLRLRDEPAEGKRMTIDLLKGILKNRTFLMFLMLVFLISIPQRMNDVMFGLYLLSNGGTDSMVGWGWAIAAGVELPAFLLINRYLKRIHEFALIGVVGILFSVRWFLYTVFTEPWMLLMLQAGAMVTFAVFWISAVHYTARILPVQLGATGQSVLAMVFIGLAGIVGSSVGGWLKDNYGGASMYFFAASVSLLGGIGFLFVHFSSRRGRIKSFST